MSVKRLYYINRFSDQRPFLNNFLAQYFKYYCMKAFFRPQVRELWLQALYANTTDIAGLFDWPLQRADFKIIHFEFHKIFSNEILKLFDEITAYLTLLNVLYQNSLNGRVQRKKLFALFY